MGAGDQPYVFWVAIHEGLPPDLWFRLFLKKICLNEVFVPVHFNELPRRWLNLVVSHMGVMGILVQEQHEGAGPLLAASTVPTPLDESFQQAQWEFSKPYIRLCIMFDSDMSVTLIVTDE